MVKVVPKPWWSSRKPPATALALQPAIIKLSRLHPQTGGVP